MGTYLAACPGATGSDSDTDARNEGVVAGLVRDVLPRLLDRLSSEGRRLPRFVRSALEAMRDCGDITAGFVRLECTGCRAPAVVPFSCKQRICATCSGRMMSERAAHLVDRVLPEVRWRQWVVTFPWELSRRLAYDRDLAGAVVRVVVRVLFECQRRRCDTAVGDDERLHPSAVVWIQRFSDGAGLFFHLHLLLPDGVHRASGDRLDVDFLPAGALSDEQVQRCVTDLERRIGRLLRRRGVLPTLGSDAQLLLTCADAAPATTRRRPGGPARARRRVVPLCAERNGFRLHAATTVDAGDRPGLERICRYLARPALPLDRISRRADGAIVFDLKRPRRGVTRMVFEPLAFLARICSLVPPPGFHMTRFYGGLAAGSPIRAAIVPAPPQPTPDRPTAPKRPATMGWADLLQRVFETDITRCACGGTFRIVAAIRTPTVVEAILAAIVLSTNPNARPPPVGRHPDDPVLVVD